MTPEIRSESSADQAMNCALGDLTPELLALIGDEPCENYFVTETDPETGAQRLTERYRKRLSRETGEYVLELDRLGLEREAGSVANCYTLGKVFKRCRKRHFAKAFPIRCHDFGCSNCGRGYNRVRTWGGSRDLDRIFSEPQTALELTMPRQGTMRESRDRMMRFGDKLLKKVGCDSVAHDVLDPNSKSATLRIMLKGLAPCWRHKWVKRQWKSIAGRSASCSLRRIEPGEPVKEAFSGWLFAGVEPILSLSGRIRAEIRLAFVGRHVVRTKGDFYSPLPKEELKARKEAHRARQSSEECPRCRDGKPLETIPVEQRVSAPVEQIIASDRVVVWTSEFPSPWDEPRRRRVIAKGSRSLSDNSEAVSDSDPPSSRYRPN
jgi:hypothetical protein